ncbi:hypothetical protein [Variovorax sp. RA8]|uniref:hypothetical protein n=1 Tax=Variovorax sp. (strain JCM 16519 / RA8) TaxID=662548 RepID=UPI0013A5536C|nr:hypothetical protein [Variovorax sp. RA8]
MQIGTTQPDTTNSNQLRVYWAKVPAKTGFQVAVAYSSSADTGYAVSVLRGRDPTSPLIAGSVAQTGDGFPTPWTVTSGPLEANADVLGFCGNNQGAQTWSVAAPFAIDSQEGSGNYWPGCVASAVSPGTAAMSPAFGSTVGGQAAVFVVGFREAAGGGGTAVNPGAGTVAITGFAPSIAQPHSATPGTGAIALTGFAPTIGQPHSAAPGAGAVGLTGYAPTISQPHSAVPGAGAIAITGYAPTVTQSGAQNVAPGAGAIVLTGHAPTVTQGSPAPEPTRNAGFESGPRFVSFKPLLQRILEARAERRVKPAKERAAKRAKVIEVQAAELVLQHDGAEERFRELMAGWLAQRPVIPSVVAEVDPMQLFMAQVAFRIQQMQAEEQARARLAAQDEEEALIALLLA